MTDAPTSTARILVVEDHELLAQSLSLALEAQRMRVDLARLDDYHALVESVRTEPPDVVLLDLELGSGIGDGTRLVRPFAEAGSRVLVVTAVTEPRRLGAALEEGAVGVTSKWQSFDLLLDTVLAVTRGEEVMGADERARLISALHLALEREQELREPFERLTDREQQVLHALGDGRSVATIAAEWVVSEATVRTQVRAVLTKLGVSSQLEAVARARKAGWLS